MKLRTKIIICAIVLGVQSYLFWEFAVSLFAMPGGGILFIVVVPFTIVANIIVAILLRLFKQKVLANIMFICSVAMVFIIWGLITVASRVILPEALYATYQFTSNGHTYRVNLANYENTFTIEQIDSVRSNEYYQSEGDYYQLLDTTRLITEGYINGAYIANGRLHRFSKESQPILLEKIEPGLP
jgi:ABC-type multidrug transport system fused ATPase/permease subunit